MTEITGMEGDVITMQDIFLFDWKAGVESETGRALGKLEPTGIRPGVTDRLKDLGVPVSVSWFAPDSEPVGV